MLQWFLRDESLISRDESLVSSDESLVSRETRRGVVTYFWAVLYERHFCSAGIELHWKAELENIKQVHWMRRSRFVFGSRSVDWMFGSFSFAGYCLFTLLHVLTEAFFRDLTAHFFHRNHYSMVFDCDCQSSQAANSMGYFCCGRSGVQSLCFIGRWHDSVDRRFDEVR